MWSDSHIADTTAVMTTTATHVNTHKQQLVIRHTHAEQHSATLSVHDRAHSPHINGRSVNRR